MSLRTRTGLSFSAFLFVTPLVAQAESLSFDTPITDHAVLQRDASIQLWGRASVGSEIAVTFGRVAAKTRTGADGRWFTRIGPLRANAQPRTLSIRGKENEVVELEDVLVGDVFICAGQSNMQLPMSATTGGAAAALPAVRLRRLSIPHPSQGEGVVGESKPWETDAWTPCSAEIAAHFSAIGYLFAARVQKDAGVPIGMIQLSYDGAPIESFLPRSTMARDPALRGLLERWFDNEDYPEACRRKGREDLATWLENEQGAAPPHPFGPSFLFESCLRSRARMPIRGVVWYQGESNATGFGKDGSDGEPVSIAVNQHKIEALVKGWRTELGNADLPFFCVQLPATILDWAPFREAQSRAAAALDGVYCAVTLDLYDGSELHPRDKAPVADRLARFALAHCYQQKLVSKGPVYEEHSIRGKEVHVTFANAGGLKAASGDRILGFEIAGKDREFHDATAVQKDGRIVLTSQAVPKPAAVRYGYRSAPKLNLVNGAGLPAMPFRTDSWDI